MNEQALLLSALAALVLSLPLIAWGNRKGIEPEGQRIVRQARAAGRVAQGRLQNSVFLPGTGDKLPRQREDTYWLSYVYTVDGVDYTYRTQAAVHGAQPPAVLPLYYPAGQPGRAVPAGSTKRGAAYSLWLLLPLALWVVLYYGVFS